MEFDKDDLILCGWIIEHSYNGKYWSQHSNNKVYATERIAENALIEILKVSSSKVIPNQYRISEIYRLSTKMERWVNINRILE